MSVEHLFVALVGIELGRLIGNRLGAAAHKLRMKYSPKVWVLLFQNAESMGPEVVAVEARTEHDALLKSKELGFNTEFFVSSHGPMPKVLGLHPPLETTLSLHDAMQTALQF